MFPRPLSDAHDLCREIEAALEGILKKHSAGLRWFREDAALSVKATTLDLSLSVLLRPKPLEKADLAAIAKAIEDADRAAMVAAQNQS